MLTFKTHLTKNIAVAATNKEYYLFYVTDDRKVINTPILMREWDSEKNSIDEIRKAILSLAGDKTQLTYHNNTYIKWSDFTIILCPEKDVIIVKVSLDLCQLRWLIVKNNLTKALSVGCINKDKY